MKRKIIIAIAILLCLFGGIAIYIEKTNVNNELMFYGNIDTRTVYLGFRFIGKIDKLDKDEGDKVFKDEVVASLDNEQLKISIKNIEAQLDGAHATLLKLQNGYRQEEIDDAKGSYEEALAQVKMLEDVYKRQEVLNRSNATTKELYTSSKYNYEYALGTLTKAKATYDLRLNGNRIEDIMYQNATVNALKAQLESAKKDLADSYLVSPVDGIILKRYKEEGSIATAGERVLEISKQDEFWVKAYIDETNLGEISQGDRVYVYTDVSKTPYNGTIGYISPIAEFTPKNIETIDLRADLVYYFRVLIENPDTKLKQGIPVNIKLDK